MQEVEGPWCDGGHLWIGCQGDERGASQVDVWGLPGGGTLHTKALGQEFVQGTLRSPGGKPAMGREEKPVGRGLLTRTLGGISKGPTLFREHWHWGAQEPF